MDSIDVTYRLPDGDTWQSRRHGGDRGSKHSFNLAEGDYISKVEGKTEYELVAQLTFTVTKGNGSTVRYGPYGKTGLIPFSVQGNIISFFGSSGNLLDSIGFYSYSNLSRSELFGGTYNGSHLFDSNPNSPQSAATGPALKISKLLIRSGN